MNEKLYFTPCEFPCLTDAAAIQAAVTEANRSDIRAVVIPAKADGSSWKLETPVFLTNNTTIIIDGAIIESTQAAFVNSKAGDLTAKSLGGEEHDIFIVGRNGAKLCGGAGDPQILFNNVKNYRVAGITFAGGEGIKLVHTRYGKIQQVKFQNTKYGICLAEGCNNNLIMDVEAETQQEAILMASGTTEIWGRGAEIYDSSVCRVSAKTAGAPAVALYADASEAYNLFFRDITDATEGEGTSVIIGNGAEPEIRDISVRGVDSQRQSVKVAAFCDGVYLANLWGAAPEIAEETTRMLVDETQMEIELPLFRESDNTPYITPNDPAYYGATDAETIQNAVDAAARQGVKLVIPRMNVRAQQLRWDIEKAIRLPSNITVELWGAHLRQADFVYDNMFVNADAENENITITGVGDAAIDTGKPNGLKEKNSGTLGLPDISVNATMLFKHVTGLTVENVFINESRWYSVVCYYCRQGRIADIDLQAHPIFPDLGGFQLRSGCHDFLIENITGLSGEDMVILGGQGFDDSRCAANGKSMDIHDILVRNIKANTSRCYHVNILAHDGRKVHHVVAETLLDCSLAEQKKQPYASVRIGTPHGYCQAPGAIEDIHDITVRDINSRGGRTVEIGGRSQNVTICNIHAFTSSVSAIQTAVRPDAREYILAPNRVEPGCITAEVRDYYANGVFFRCTQGSRYMRGTATSIITDKRKFVGLVLALDSLKAENFVVENVLAERVGNGVRVTGQANVEVKNFQAADCGRELAVCGSNCRLTLNGEVIPQTTAKKL